MLGIMIISILGYGTFFEIVHIEWKCITQPLSQRRCLGNVKFMITAVYIVITYDECVHFHGAFIWLPMLQVRTWMFLLLQPPISCIGWEFPITATKAILCLLDPINQRPCFMAHAQQIPRQPLPVGQASATSMKVSVLSQAHPFLWKQLSCSLEWLPCMTVSYFF